MLNQSQTKSKLALTRAKLRSMHSELSYGLSIAPKLQRVGSIHFPGWDQPTPDPSFSLPCQEKLFIWPPFFQYNKRLLRQKTGGACFHMPQDGHWLASFEDMTPPQKVSFPRPKSPLKTVFLIHFFDFFGVFCLCGENFVTPFSTLAMIKGSLPTNSTTPDRLRPWTKTESEDFPGFGVRTLSKKSFSKSPKSNPDLHPKRSP